MQTIDKINKILHRYEVFFIDIVGVVHNGITPYNGVVSTINALIEEHKKKVFFLSNNPRPGLLNYDKLVSFGISKNMQVFTSGDATRYALQNIYHNNKIYHLGANRNTEITKDLPLNFVEDIQDSNLILLTAFLEPNEDINYYKSDLEAIIDKKLKVICANPDLQAFNGNDIRRCAGYIAQYLKKQNVVVEYLGKPNKMIYEYACRAFNMAKSDKMLMIGDTMEMDVFGAENFGIDSLLVLTGKYRIRDVAKKCFNQNIFVQIFAPTDLYDGCIAVK